jgi:hypothetical protein
MVSAFCAKAVPFFNLFLNGSINSEIMPVPVKIDNLGNRIKIMNKKH